MNRRLLIIPALSTLLTAGCDGRLNVVTPDEPQVATGHWTGRNFLGRFEVVLAEDPGGRVIGSGSIRSGLNVIAFSVEGANAFPDVSLTLEFGGEALLDPRIGAEFVSYLAEFDASAQQLGLAGRLNGGFLQENALRLERN
jgi:hypothetical protein